VHSLVSDWNHGNAHFLRGVVSELLALGHEVVVREPRNAWSVENLRREQGPRAIEAFRRAYPELKSVRYSLRTLDPAEAVRGADVVVVHEWNDPALVSALGENRRRTGNHLLLFHDTHHRAVTAPAELRRFDLSAYDAVLAFGGVIRDLYLRQRWARRAYTWHEAADVRIFRPLPGVPRRGELVWVGNWGDEERTRELHEFLLQPVRALGLRARLHGVRYPPEARAALRASGIRYGGWIPNFSVPQLFAAHLVTVHVPRRPYARRLPGIPTIRPFEALACGIPLISAPWRDAERLFTPGEDFLVARDGREMRAHLRLLMRDPLAARQLATRGLATVLARHTCRHRALELLAIVADLGRAPGAARPRSRPPASRANPARRSA
jgi:spore maturation protein CgeB